MGPLDPSQNKALFKKRIYRPWNPPLEATFVEPTKEEKGAFIDQLPSPKILPLESPEPLAIQNPSPTSTEAVLIGGFFYPKQQTGIPLESGAIHNLMQELKSKEQEILLLDHDLQVNRALEEARKAEAAQAHEANARKSAEENALFAIQKAKLAAEQAHKAESQVLAEKQLRLELERTKKALEERLQNALRAIEKKEADRLEEEMVRKSTEEKLMIIKTQMDNRISAIQKETQKKIQDAHDQITIHEKAKLMAQSCSQKSLETARQSESARLALEEQVSELQTKQAAQLEQVRMLEIEQQTMKDNHALASHLLSEALERAKNLEAIVEVERELRKQCEQKMTDASIRSEESKRKLSEDRLILMEQEINALETEKSKIEDKLFKTQRSIRNLEIMRLSSE